MQTYIPVSGSALTCAQASRLVPFLYKKGQKKSSRLERLRRDTIESPSAAAPAVSTEPLPVVVALATGIENVPTRHLPEDTLFSCSLLILYPDLRDNATLSADHRKRDYRNEDARILPVPAFSSVLSDVLLKTTNNTESQPFWWFSFWNLIILHSPSAFYNKSSYLLHL